MKPLYVVLVEQHLLGAGQKGQAAEQVHVAGRLVHL